MAAALNQGASVGEIAAASFTTFSVASRSLTALIESELVILSCDPLSRRRRAARLTPRGELVAQRLSDAFGKIMRKV